MPHLKVLAGSFIGLCLWLVSTAVQAGPPRGTPCEEHQSGSPWCERAALLECRQHRSSGCAELERDFRGYGQGVPPWFLPSDFDDTAQLTPLILSIPETPQPVRATDKKFHLVYELELLNFGTFGAQPPSTPVPILTVAEVVIRDAEHPHGPPLMVLNGDALIQRMQTRRLGIASSATPIQLVPGQSAVVFLDVTVSNRGSVPKSLLNQVKVVAVPETGQPPVVNVTELETPVNQTPVVVIGPSAGAAGPTSTAAATLPRRIAASVVL